MGWLFDVVMSLIAIVVTVMVMVTYFHVTFAIIQTDWHTFWSGTFLGNLAIGVI